MLLQLYELLDRGGDEFMAAEEKRIRTFDMTDFVRKKAEAARKEVAIVLEKQAEMDT